MSNRLDIVVPGLCGPFPKDTVIPDDEASRALAGWLHAAGSGTSTDTFSSVLAACLALDHPLAMAALELLAFTRDHIHHHVLIVEPVHLRADMDHAILMDETMLDLRQTEREQLLAELNAHFAQDDIRIEACGDRWFIISEQGFGIDTTPVDQVIGRNVNAFLPQGDRASWWRRFMNEAQMLLHISDVNARREGRGQLPVNSLWLWGNGKLKTEPASPYRYIIGDENLAVSLSAYTGAALLAPTQAVDEMDGDALLIETRLSKHACYGDIESWSAQVSPLLEQTLLPLSEKATRRGMEVCILPCDGRLYALGRRSLGGILSSLFRRPDPAQVISHDS